MALKRVSLSAAGQDERKVKSPGSTIHNDNHDNNQKSHDVDAGSFHFAWLGKPWELTLVLYALSTRAGLGALSPWPQNASTLVSKERR